MARADFAVRAPADGRATRGADRIDQSTSPLLRFASVCSVSPFVNSRSPLRITFVSPFLPISANQEIRLGADAEGLGDDGFVSIVIGYYPEGR